MNAGQRTETLDVSRRQVEEVPCDLGEQTDGTSVDSLKMPEEQRQTHEMAGAKLVGQSLQWHCDTVGDPRIGQILLQLVDV